MSYHNIEEDVRKKLSDRYYQDFNICQDIYPKIFKMRGVIFALAFRNPIPIPLVKKIMDLIIDYEI